MYVGGGVSRTPSSDGDKMHYGHIYHPKTGAWLASVKDGKITARGDVSYSLVGDMIVAADGTKLGYLALRDGLTKGNSDLANRLFPR
jgi:hypothetical protein